MYYYIQRVQLMGEGNFVPRLAFALWYLHVGFVGWMRARDPRFPATLFFTNEATLTLEEMFNSLYTHV